jgi:GDP-mannose 6-dehydrogenase
MKIAILGLGYVGSVSAACFAKQGFSIIGVDPQQIKVDLINSGRSPVIEGGLEDLVAESTRTGRLRATTDAAQAVAESDMAIICVGTPSLANGSLDFRSLTRACEEIGSTLRRQPSRYLIVVRSTVLPGVMRSLVIPSLEAASGKRAGRDFDVVNNPEFLREGTAIQDFRRPPMTLIGGDDEKAKSVVAQLYDGIDAPVIMTSLEVAAMVKYVNNAWHALKVTFGNEIGNICKALSIDGRRVMDIFCTDTKLNISSAYLKPGFAFGGSCLPKDLRALTHLAKGLDVSVPVLDSIMQSNRRQIERAIERIVELDRRRIGVLGISFKAGTDDLRESPMVELVERLIGKGFDLRLYDRNVGLARLVGANRDYILRRIPHISNLITDDISEVLGHGEVIIVGNGDQEFHRVSARLSPEQYVVDMAGLPGAESLAGRYDGINW